MAPGQEPGLDDAAVRWVCDDLALSLRPAPEARASALQTTAERVGSTSPSASVVSPQITLPEQLRAYQLAADAPALMRVVAFDLRQSTRELLLRDEAARRRGLQRAFIASLFCGQKGHAQLRALIFEGWILPNLASAPREPWRDLNRSMLLERACAAFVQSKEPLKLRALLEALILRGNDEQVQDWARIKLASLCVQEDRLREAVSLLRQVRAPSMKGSIRWAEEIEAQIKAQNKKPREEPPPVVPKS